MGVLFEFPQQSALLQLQVEPLQGAIDGFIGLYDDLDQEFNSSKTSYDTRSSRLDSSQFRSDNQSMNLQVGAGHVRLPGFLNVDVRSTPEVDIVGHAGSLPSVETGSVDLLFSNAVFEHVYVCQQMAVLAEWKRVLAPTGVAAAIGIPDFETVARLYLEKAPGLVGPRFDLYHAYRYTHGDPEQCVPLDAWQSWRPDLHVDQAPSGWIPQLHKTLLDADRLRDLIQATGIQGAVFRYAFPGEPYRLNLGFVAGMEVPKVEHVLNRIPTIDRFINFASIEVIADRSACSALPLASIVKAA